MTRDPHDPHGGQLPAGVDSMDSADAPPQGAHDETASVLAEARQLCELLHVVPAQRRAACCSGAAVDPAAQSAADACAITLSAAVASGGVVLDDTALTTCAAASETDLAGCAWVGASPAPRPAPCSAAVHGTLTAQSRCLSHRECAPGLRCTGLGPGLPGQCATANGPSTVDPADLLAHHLRDDLPPATPAKTRCSSDADCPGLCTRASDGRGTCAPRCTP